MSEAIPSMLVSKSVVVHLTSLCQQIGGLVWRPQVEVLGNLSGIAKTALRGSMLAAELSWDIRGWQFFSSNTVVESAAVR